MYTTYLHGEKKMPPPYTNNANTRGRQAGNAFGHLHDPEQVTCFNPHNSTVTLLSRVLYLFTSLVSTIRYNGTKPVKSTEVTQQYIYFVLSTTILGGEETVTPNGKGIHQQAPCGNRFPKAKLERKRSFFLTRTTTLFRTRQQIFFGNRQQNQVTYIYPTMRKIHYCFFGFDSINAFKFVRRLRATFF